MVQHRDCSLQLPLLRQPPSVGFPAWQGKTQNMQPENQARNKKTQAKTLIPDPLIQIDEPPMFVYISFQRCDIPIESMSEALASSQ